jgi:hypothetical protein
MPQYGLDRTQGAPSRTKPIGRTLRFLAGVWLMVLTLRFYGSADGAAIAMTLGMALGLFAMYASIHFLFQNYLSRLNTYFGALLCWIPAVLVYSMGGVQGRVALLTYLGISLLLAGVRADPGCEVMSIPGLTFKKSTHLACLCFSPIDWLEAKLYRYARGWA